MKIRVMALVATAALALPAVAAAEQPTRQDRVNAAKECKALRSAMGTQNFRNQYGTNANGRNAFGRCVSARARDEAAERRTARSNAARDCRAERNDPNFPQSHEGKTFEEFYGTGNRRNAFGKCVSQKARANEQAADEADRQRVNAARACRAEQRDPDFAQEHGGQSFNEFYGRNANDRNAFGKCVSQKARAQQQEQQPTS